MNRPTVLLSAMAMMVGASAALADVPPAPVNQNLGFNDGVFNALAEADCRLCHEDGAIVNGANIPGRHH